MPTLLMSSLTAASPYNTPPAGWTRPAWSQTTQVTVSGGANHFQRLSGTGGQMGAWVNTTAITANTIFASTTHGINATQAGNDSARLCIVNSSGNGYTLWLNQAATTARIYTVVAGTLTTQLVEFTGYGTGYSQTFEIRCTDKTTGTFKFLRNGVQVGSDLVDTTYTGLDYAGCASSGGRVTGMTVGSIFDILTITNPMTSGGAFSGTSAGAADGAGTIATGGQTVAITFAGGGTTYSGTWTAFADGLVYPVTNGSTLTFTITESGGGSKTIDSVFNLPADYAYTPIGTVITDPAYLGSVYSLTSGWNIYYDETQLGGMEIFPDSRVDVTNDGTFTCFVHELGSGNDLVELTVTVNGGAIVSGGGLTTLGLVSPGLVRRGLVRAGL